MVAVAVGNIGCWNIGCDVSECECRPSEKTSTIAPASTQIC